MKVSRFLQALEKIERSYGSERAAAKALGVSHGAFNNWKQGRSNPSVDSLESVAKLAGFQPSEFLDDGTCIGRAAANEWVQKCEDIVQLLEHQQQITVKLQKLTCSYNSKRLTA
ncbi:MAG: hypothetical protein DDT26_00128 [Dehalococcoidia bacterium]|nr:hypothetical protein [Chloroflexota bacterium]